MERTHSPHPPAETVSSPGQRRLAWLNIIVQAVLPLTLAFTPAVAGAGDPRLLQHAAPLPAQRTQVYTLGDGETAASVAKKFHLTLEQLRELNQFRTFAHGLNGLQPGDDIDVPARVAEDKTTVSSSPSAAGVSTASSSSSVHQEDDEQAKKMAGYISQAPSVLASGDAAVSAARGLATREAGGALQQWLGRFGTARVQLDTDRHFSLKNSQLDLLLPLYDRGDNLVFTQGSLHRTDSRGQINLGAGLRHFTPAYMLGGSLFGDYDLSREHARLGAGVEYWRDYLKLGANGYMRLTDWRDSPDLSDYQERPANGWDVRVQAWVPALPQLGGKLTYEQYYGKEVALFGVDNRQKDPHAVTAGINYTPVPLLTLGAERRQGQSGKSDTRLTVDMNYRFGVPWRSQVDPGAVAAMRSLAGSRYDLVERNNHIVLEYRKKDVIRLHTAGRVVGQPGELKSLGVSVTSTHGLARIDWDAAALNTAGGKIVQNGGDYTVVLPAYQSSAQGVNIYTISGVAVDTKGNRSDRSDTQVTVLAPEVNRQTSTFTPVSSALPADGKSTQALTLTLRDENSQVVDIDVKDISLKNSPLKSATVSALAKQSVGVYTVTVTAGTDNETVTLTPAVNGVTLSPATVSISSTTPDAGQSVFTATPDIITADNTATSTLTLVVKDAQGNALTGLADSLSFRVKDSSGNAPAVGVITQSALTESSTKGTYTATLRGTAADRYTVVPQHNGADMGSLSAPVTLTAILPDAGQSLIASDRAAYISGEDILITVTLRDKEGTALTGNAGLLTSTTVTVPNAVLKTGSSWKDNGDGTYMATYTAVTASTGNLATLTLNGWGSVVQSVTYDITSRKTEFPESVNTYKNPHSFVVSGEVGAFPSTGFTGATFTVVPKDGREASDYTWQSDASWVTVNNLGRVTFTGTGSGNKVTITGTPKSGPGNIIKYSFTLKSWFIMGGGVMPWSEANAYCLKQPGYSQPAVEQLTNDDGWGNPAREVGTLWSEWGSMARYPITYQPSFWTSTLFHNTPDTYYSVVMNVGYAGYPTSNTAGAICRRTF
ncbi:inverse autotransporter beta domain-containing protein [Salmonella enterica]